MLNFRKRAFTLKTIKPMATPPLVRRNYRMAHQWPALRRGRRGSGAGMHGVAYEADIGMYALALTGDGILTINDDILNAGLTQLANQKTQIYNHSWGMNIQFDPSLAGTQRRLMQLEYGQSVQTMIDHQGIHVWSAGNEGGNQVSATSGLPFYFEDLRGRVVVAVAVDDKGQIGTDSNRCGRLKLFALPRQAA